ncbi:MAG: pilus assembly PilX N-terminal domain-containing protein [Granulosicoccus sp.]
MKNRADQQKQTGMALPIGLILLSAMTVVGIATLSGTRQNEVIASNSQQKAISFEAAESSIDSVWNVEYVVQSLDDIPADQINNPYATESSALNAELSLDFDQESATDSGTAVDVEVSVAMQYCGETALPSGSSLNADVSGLQFAGTLMDVNGKADIAGSMASSEHIKRGYIIRPKTGRTGNCPSPT